MDASLDYLVFGQGREKGKAAAERKGEKLVAAGAKLQVLAEHDLAHLLRIDINGATFFLAGGFDYAIGGVAQADPAAIIASLGGVVVAEIEPSLDYLVVGHRRGAGKTAALRRAETLIEAGARIEVIDEDAFLELTSSQAKPGATTDLSGFLASLVGMVDPRRFKRALAMLQKEAFEIYIHATETSIAGVVKSQTSFDKIYACRLGDDGLYACADGHLDACMGLQGAICKHLIVLVIASVHHGDIPSSAGAAPARSSRPPCRNVSSPRWRCAASSPSARGACATPPDTPPRASLGWCSRPRSSR